MEHRFETVRIGSVFSAVLFALSVSAVNAFVVWFAVTTISTALEDP
jgi:hypothetical protein